MPDAAPVERASFDSTESLFPDTAGQVALAHGVDGGEWGIAWSDAQADRTTISLLRIAATDFHIKDGPVDIRPEAIAASNPSIAYNNGYYMVTWVEQLGGFNFPIYEATYGCTR
jgi:hypothetical protein